MAGQFGPWMRLSWNNYKPQPRENPYVPAKPAAKAPPPVDDDQDVPF
jgi:hypothetical protein